MYNLCDMSILHNVHKRLGHRVAYIGRTNHIGIVLSMWANIVTSFFCSFLCQSKQINKKISGDFKNWWEYDGQCINTKRTKMTCRKLKIEYTSTKCFNTRYFNTSKHVCCQLVTRIVAWHILQLPEDQNSCMT